MSDTCHFCGAQDACYQKRDENGAFKDCCFVCAKAGNPVPKQFRKAVTK